MTHTMIPQTRSWIVDFLKRATRPTIASPPYPSQSLERSQVTQADVRFET